MEAKELRIGNWVNTYQFGDRFDFEIESIDCEGVNLKDGAYLSYIKDLKPIPLTEEWLLKFGFIEQYSFYTLCGFSLRNGIKGVFHFRVSDNIGLIEIKYIHQLQNLYFALTGEELKLKTNE